MGYFSKIKASSDFEKVLSAHGINPRTIPHDISARILTYAWRQHERTAQMFPDSDCREAREASMQNAGMLVAFCMLGPTSFRNNCSNYEYVNEMVEYEAEGWKEYGSEYSHNTMIIKTLSDAGILNDEFVDKFNALI